MNIDLQGLITSLTLLIVLITTLIKLVKLIQDTPNKKKLYSIYHVVNIHQNVDYYTVDAISKKKAIYCSRREHLLRRRTYCSVLMISSQRDKIAPLKT